jgi:hypothetical protein
VFAQKRSPTHATEHRNPTGYNSHAEQRAQQAEQLLQSATLTNLKSSISLEDWVRQDRWDALTPEQQDGFVPLCPDFVLELRSKNDNMEPLRAKMREYMENKARLGWLIDGKNKKVEIYRQGQEVEVLDNPTTLSGEDVLPGFVLDLTEVWS